MKKKQIRNFFKAEKTRIQDRMRALDPLSAEYTRLVMVLSNIEMLEVKQHVINSKNSDRVLGYVTAGCNLASGALNAVAGPIIYKGVIEEAFKIEEGFGVSQVMTKELLHKTKF